MFKKDKKTEKSLGLLAWASFAPLLGSSLASFIALRYEAVLQAMSSAELAIFWLTTVLLVTLATLPTTFVALLYGFLLGFSKALFWVVAGYLLAAWLNYKLVRLLDSGNLWVLLQKNEKLARVAARLQNSPILLIVAVRISPVLPFSIMNMIFAVLNTNMRRFLLGSFVGMLPRTIAAVYIGSQASDLYKLFHQPTTNELWIKLLPLILLGISMIVLGIYANKIWKEAAEHKKE